jgi:hypothetical protein
VVTGQPPAIPSASPRWAFNQVLIGVATRKYARSIRLPDGDLAGQAMRPHRVSQAF